MVLKCVDQSIKMYWFDTIFRVHIDGLVQERRNSSALAMELRLIALTHWYVIHTESISITFYLDQELFDVMMIEGI